MNAFSIIHKHHEFYFCDKEFKTDNEMRTDNEYMEIIPDKVFLYIQNIEYNTIFEVLGYDKNKIDFAYPEQLRNTDSAFNARINSGDQPFWYYDEKNNIFGRPLWRNDIMHDFKTEMKKIFFKHTFSKCNTYEVD